MRHNPKTSARRRQRGLTLVEVAMATSILGLILTTTLSVYAVAARSGDRNQRETGLVGGARAAMDEVLFALRAAGQVHGQQSVGGVTYSASATQVVLSAPAYNPANAAYFLDGVSDYAILRYDAGNQQLVQTLVPGTGSARPARQNMVLARNVTACSFRYVVREYFSSANNNNARFNLSAQPLATPTVYVNGVARSVSYNANNASINTSLTEKRNDIQVVYAVSPTTNNTTMALVGEVEVSLDLTTTDSRRLTVSNTLVGAARLRNARK
jgi:prepilin-type N-terminal cleavage/methylation domain-containing protein